MFWFSVISHGFSFLPSSGTFNARSSTVSGCARLINLLSRMPSAMARNRSSPAAAIGRYPRPFRNSSLPRQLFRCSVKAACAHVVRGAGRRWRRASQRQQTARRRWHPVRALVRAAVTPRTQSAGSVNPPCVRTGNRTVARPIPPQRARGCRRCVVHVRVMRTRPSPRRQTPAVACTHLLLLQERMRANATRHDRLGLCARTGFCRHSWAWTIAVLRSNPSPRAVHTARMYAQPPPLTRVGFPAAGSAAESTCSHRAASAGTAVTGGGRQQRNLQHLGSRCNRLLLVWLQRLPLR